VARGWESKSVEEQQVEYAESEPIPRHKLTSQEIAKQRLKDGLTLNRRRIIHQLQDAQNPHHRAVLESALAHLDAEIARLG
jgi:hypothetical protein